MVAQKQVRIGRLLFEDGDYQKVKEYSKKYQLEIAQIIKILVVQRLREGKNDIF